MSPHVKSHRLSQVNVRLTQDEATVLQAIALIDERSNAEVLKPIVVAYLNKRAQEADVAEILAVLERKRESSEKTVTQ